MRIDRLLLFMILVAVFASTFFFVSHFFMGLPSGWAMLVASLGVFIGVFAFGRFLKR